MLPLAVTGSQRFHYSEKSSQGSWVQYKLDKEPSRTRYGTLGSQHTVSLLSRTISEWWLASLTQHLSLFQMGKHLWTGVQIFCPEGIRPGSHRSLYLTGKHSMSTIFSLSDVNAHMVWMLWSTHGQMCCPWLLRGGTWILQACMDAEETDLEWFETAWSTVVIWQGVSQAQFDTHW